MPILPRRSLRGGLCERKPEDAVVNVYRFQAVKPNHAVKLCQHTVEVVYNVIPGIEHVAGIEAHAHMVGKFNALDDRRKLLERATHFSTLARHGFEQHRSGLFRCEHLVGERPRK